MYHNTLTASIRSELFQDSPIRKLAKHANDAKKRGVHIHHLNIGQPDLATPSVCLEAIKSHTPSTIGYTPSEGLLDFRKATAHFLQSNYHTNINEENIVVTTGGTEALLFAMQSCADPESEFITPLPCYTNYIGLGQLTGIRIKGVLSNIHNNFALPSVEDIERTISKQTKAIIICNPNNPTGHVYTRSELTHIATICKRYNLFLIVDEAYREFVYEGEIQSALSLQGVDENLIIVDTLSKRYSACGLRIGFFISKNQELIKKVCKIAQMRLSPPLLGQIGGKALLELPASYYDSVRVTYQKRRDVVVEGLQSIPGVICHKPQGAFYVVCQLPVKSSEDFCKWMLTDFSLNNQTVMITPSNGFYGDETSGAQEVRIAYVVEEYKLKESLTCIEEGLKQYKESHQ